jgi:hypothetical protein
MSDSVDRLCSRRKLVSGLYRAHQRSSDENLKTAFNGQE